MMERNAKIWVAGQNTLLGGAIQRRLEREGFVHRICEPAKLDWMQPQQVEAFLGEARPQYLFLAAGRSGGIGANQQFPADLMRDNLLTFTNVIGSAHRHGVTKLLYLASSCSYPRDCPQPMRPEMLMTGPLEPTNHAYATAKLAGIALCQAYRQQYGVDFITVIPANDYGPGDDFSADNAHVVSALIRKMHMAKQEGAAYVTVWGSGQARREFAYADDLADACLFAMQNYSDAAPLNLGSGEEVSIAELAEAVRAVVGYTGELQFDTTRPDGMPLKRLDTTPLRAMGWQPATSLKEGLEATYAWFLDSPFSFRGNT
ncbi:MAG TPA: GDP-L-fucose synthase [Chthonomonadaceae bacterium]|nr:GDP-L-fucose synthase [Chthonomonadaceae bacterium]